ncbi:MAG: LamG domain-containing protein, partial [Patescibacteria group bacterium]|nr:LamG domain-containing protein [Patescibacteria group bacterium]
MKRLRYLPLCLLAILAFCIPKAHAGTAGVSQYGPTTLYSGLIGWWTFDGKNLVQDVADSSGNGNDGFMRGWTSTSSAVVSGQAGQALSFTGSQRVALPRLSATEGVSQLSWSVWVMPTSFGTFSEAVLTKLLESTSGNWGIYVFPGNCIGGNYIGMYISASDGDSSTLACGAPISANVWTHYVFVYDGTQTGNANRLVVYKNGVLQSGLVFAGTIPAATVVTTRVASIGARSNSSEPYWGNIDDVRIYNRALSANEVTQLYNSTTGSYQNTS